jgi:hypothetical protein
MVAEALHTMVGQTAKAAKMAEETVVQAEAFSAMAEQVPEHSGATGSLLDQFLLQIV